MLVRVPTVKAEGRVQVLASKDLFVTWTGPNVGMMEKARKQIHYGGMSLLLKVIHFV